MDFLENKAQTFFPYPAITTIIYKDCAAPVQYGIIPAQSDAKIRYREPIMGMNLKEEEKLIR
jgi:hypothetical protein